MTNANSSRLTSREGSANGSPEATPRMTVSSPSLRTSQRIHAWAITLLPAAGTVAALALAVRHGVPHHAVGLLVVMYLITIAGITVGFHRCFTHRAFRASTPVRWLLGISGSMACQGPLTYWVSNHRRHHQFSDLPGDPHSPHQDGEKPLNGWRGFWHAHFGWAFDHELTNTLLFARDLQRDPVTRALNRFYYIWALAGLVIPGLIGLAITRTPGGFVDGVLWGGLMRIFLALHATNCVNSVTHLFGSRAFDTPEHSTNNGVVAFLTLGEGWHNNHHAFPGSAIFGHTRWQFDPGAWLICAMERLGWVSDVKRPPTNGESLRGVRIQPEVE